MLSAGGSSAVFTLGAMGVLASVARHEPDAISSMQNYGRPVFDRIFFIAEPRALKQRRQAPAAAPRRERYGTPVTQPVAAAYHRQPHRRTPRR